MMKEKILTNVEELLDMMAGEMPTDLCGCEVQQGYTYAMAVIKKKAPEYRGEWVRANVLHDNEDGIFVPSTNSRFCSACQSEAYWDHEWGTHLFKHCPFCGARMNKEV